MRPQSIVRFERLFIFGIVLNLATSIWSFRDMASLAPAGASPAMFAMMPWIAGFGIVIGLAINLALLFFIAHRHSEVAKWIFIVVFLLGLAGLVRGFSGTVLVLPAAIRVLSLVHLGIQAVCVWLLFRPDARRWFNR